MTGHDEPAANVARLKIANAERRIRHVFIRDYETEAKIGAHSHEKAGAQKVRINVDIGVVEPAEPLGDELENVVCYQGIVSKIEVILAQGHINLVETLAELIGEACLEDPRVRSARIRVEKLGAIAGARSAGVEIECNR